MTVVIWIVCSFLVWRLDRFLDRELDIHNGDPMHQVVIALPRMGALSDECKAVCSDPSHYHP